MPINLGKIIENAMQFSDDKRWQKSAEVLLGNHVGNMKVHSLAPLYGPEMRHNQLHQV